MRDELMRPNPLPEILLPPTTLQQIRDNFVGELRRASGSEQTSLGFIRNPLPRRPLAERDETFQVMVIGGTEFEQATVYNRSFNIYTNYRVPAFRTKEDFLSFLVSPKHFGLNPDTHVLAINFAFPLQSTMRDGRLDGVLMRGTKEHQFEGLVGQTVGGAVEQFVENTQNGRKILVTVANDTVCLILSGLNRCKREELVAGIVGTGYNIAFFENENTIVNLESGNFDGFEQTETGAAIDMKSENPGGQRFEKEVSGAYLYQHFNRYMGSAAPYLSSTEELSFLASRESPDRSVEIARSFLARSASLVACQIAGVYMFKKQPTMMFVMEGSLFWKGWWYKQMVDECLEKLDVPSNAVRFIEVKSSSIKGAAALASGQVPANLYYD